jgi:GDPmannose 4,6-dehydratase
MEGAWKILQHSAPDDFVLASGRSETVRSFAQKAFAQTGIEIAWEGHGSEEIGRNVKTGVPIIKIDPFYFRPTEVDRLQGNASKAKGQIGWTTKTSLEDIIAEMVAYDLAREKGEFNETFPNR